MFMKTVYMLTTLSVFMIIFGCINYDQADTVSFKPNKPMNVGEIREFTISNLSVILKKTVGDTFDLSLILLSTVEDDNSIKTNLEELILRVSSSNAQNSKAVYLSTLDGHNALTIRSNIANLDNSLNNLLNVFYNQSFDSLSINSIRFERFNSLDMVSGEDLQRYHADKFVTSRLLLVIEGNFSIDTLRATLTKSFYGKTVGEFRKDTLKYPGNPFSLNGGYGETKSDSTQHKE